MDQHTKHVIDAAAAGVTVATVLSWLPHIAAVFTIVWTAIRIWETETVQKLVRKLRLWGLG